MEPTNSYAFKTGGSCTIHDDVSFSLDEDCPVCEDDRNDTDIAVYIDHIDYLDSEISKLKKLKSANTKLTHCIENFLAHYKDRKITNGYHDLLAGQ